MSMASDTVRTMISRIVVLLIAMGQSVILARWLQPEGRGQYATLLLIPQLIAFLAPLGIQWSIVYHLRTRPDEQPQHLRAGLLIAVIAGTAGVAVAAALEASLYSVLLAGLSVTSVAAATLLVPVRVMEALLRGVFRGTDRIYMVNLLTVLRPLATFAGVVLVIVLAGAGVRGLVVVVLVAETAIVLAGVGLAFRGTGFRGGEHRLAVTSMLSYGVRIYLYTVLLFLNYRIDMGLVRYYLTYEEVGYYVTAVTIAELLWNLPNAVGFVLFPNIAGAETSRQRSLTTRICRSMVLFMGLGCVAAGLLAYPAILALYGREFLPAFRPFLWLLPGIFAMSIQQILGADVTARGQAGSVTAAAGAGLVLNIVLNLVLIPRYGPEGAAMASSVSYGVISAFVLMTFLRLSEAGLIETLVVRGGDLRQIWLRMKRLGVAEA